MAELGSQNLHQHITRTHSGRWIPCGSNAPATLLYGHICYDLAEIPSESKMGLCTSMLLSGYSSPNRIN